MPQIKHGYNLKFSQKQCKNKFNCFCTVFLQLSFLFNLSARNHLSCGSGRLCLKIIRMSMNDNCPPDDFFRKKALCIK